VESRSLLQQLSPRASDSELHPAPGDSSTATVPYCRVSSLELVASELAGCLEGDPQFTTREKTA